ncbi:MAG: ribulose-phosphate 3-epimerase [Planctomycetota bacterium]
MRALQLCLGLKADPIEYRYSYEWLFRLMAEEGVRHLQLGTFFELYQLPDPWLLRLRDCAKDFGITISSILTSHRELGGYFQTDAAWHAVARRNHERLIEIAALVGASSAGSNPGSTLRDQLGAKTAGTQRFLASLKELLGFAARHGVACLTMEPMSCLAEPPTLPQEIADWAHELEAFRKDHPETAAFGYCVDISHGYADKEGAVRYDHLALIEACLPWTTELHLRNTDSSYASTFGFTDAERKKGIVDVSAVRSLLVAKADLLPVEELIGYLEIGGPKLGRDYSDGRLAEQIRGSLCHLRETFVARSSGSCRDPEDRATTVAQSSGLRRKPEACATLPLTLEIGKVLLSPSLMCSDLCHLEESIRKLEGHGAELLHMDIMDAHFTPNMPLGLETPRQLRPKTALPFDVHLMVNDNDFFVRAAAALGAQMISVHVESSVHLDRTLALIRTLGARAGAALNPATPLDALDYVLERLDFVLLMTVNPGFAGQEAVPSAFRKIRDCCAYLAARGLRIPIEVDGNVSFENIPGMVAAGADILVAGSSSLFSAQGSLEENFRKTREMIALGLAARKGTPDERR